MFFFGDALSLLKEDIENSSMRLPTWKEDIRIKIEFNDEFTNPYLVVVSRFGKIPWIPNMYELMSADWEVKSPLITDENGEPLSVDTGEIVNYIYEKKDGKWDKSEINDILDLEMDYMNEKGLIL